MNEQERTRWVELARQDQTAVSTRFVLDLNWLDAARYVFDRNFAEAIQIPDAVETNVEFIVKADRQQEDALHREFVRRFHNYLASAKTIARRQLVLPVADNYFCRRRISEGVSPTTWRHSVVVVGRSVAVKDVSAGAPAGA